MMNYIIVVVVVAVGLAKRLVSDKDVSRSSLTIQNVSQDRQVLQMLGRLVVEPKRLTLLEVTPNQELNDEFMEDLVHGNTFALELSRIDDCGAILMEEGRPRSTLTFPARLEHNEHFPLMEYQVTIRLDKNHSQLVRDQVKEGCEAHHKEVAAKKEEELRIQKEEEEDRKRQLAEKEEDAFSFRQKHHRLLRLMSHSRLGG